MSASRLTATAAALTLPFLALNACGGGNNAERMDMAQQQVTNIGVNGYLWRASLETLDFMPMAQVDSQGGVLITDWYANPQAPEERVKVTVYILDQNLRADAVRVAAVRQQVVNGNWVDTDVRAGTVQKLEETILARARDLRRAATGL